MALRSASGQRPWGSWIYPCVGRFSAMLVFWISLTSNSGVRGARLPLRPTALFRVNALFRERLPLRELWSPRCLCTFCSPIGRADRARSNETAPRKLLARYRRSSVPCGILAHCSSPARFASDLACLFSIGETIFASQKYVCHIWQTYFEALCTPFQCRITPKKYVCQICTHHRRADQSTPMCDEGGVVKPTFTENLAFSCGTEVTQSIGLASQIRQK
jgi:hypothetical protein